MKTNKFTARNFSAARKQANLSCGIIPIEEFAFGQPSELFRFKKKHKYGFRNYSVYQNRLWSLNGIIPFEENTPVLLVEFFAWAEIKHYELSITN